jgi:hypothetical protein
MIDSSQHESQRDALHGKRTFSINDLPVQETKRYKGNYKPGRPLGAVDVIQEPWMQKPFKLPVQAVTQEQGDTASACQLAVRYPKRITNKQPLPPSWQRWYVSEFRRLELTWRDTRAAVDAHRLWYHRLFVAHDMCAGSADYAEQKRHMREASADHYKGMTQVRKHYGLCLSTMVIYPSSSHRLLKVQVKLMEMMSPKKYMVCCSLFMANGALMTPP